METNKFNVIELSLTEAKGVNGGKPFWKKLKGGKIGYFLLAELAWELVTDGVEECWDDFVEGFESVSQ